MTYRFQWRGGVHKPNENETYKFYIFAMLEGQEIIHFEAKKRNIFYKASPADADRESYGFSGFTGDDFMSITQNVKIFMAQQGFGIRKSYFSFFFRFMRSEERIINIRPFGSHASGHFFRARGQFMTADEIKDLVGEDSDTWGYYNRQSYLSQSELRQIVTIDHLDRRSAGPVRSIRV